jgi:uncharacterized protein (TIGR02246 family)
VNSGPITHPLTVDSTDQESTDQEKEATMTTTSQPTASDQQAVGALPGRIGAAWAAHDADAFANVFVPDGTMILPGVFRKGHDEIRGFMAAGFAGPFRGTRVTGEPLDLQFLTPDSAVLTTSGGVLAPGETEVSAGQAIRASWVVVKRDGEWLVAAYQNSPANVD